MKKKVKTNLTEVAMDVLDKYKDMQVNLASEEARKMIAKDFSEEATEWIRNLWKEDFQP